MKKVIICFFLSILLMLGWMNNSLVFSHTNSDNTVFKKLIKGKIIYSKKTGSHPKNLGYLRLKIPNVLTISLLDSSIADAPSKVIRRVVIKNVKSLPHNFSIPVEGIPFTRRYTYTLNILLDVNMDNSLTNGNFFNSMSHRVPIDNTVGDIVIKDVYIERQN